MKQLQVGDNVYVQLEYALYRGVVVKLNPKGVNISFPAQSGCVAYTQRYQYHKVAHEDESIAPIWESYKGVNGRGGYRLERELYPEYRKPTNQWKWQEYLCEDSHGVLNARYKGDAA